MSYNLSAAEIELFEFESILGFILPIIYGLTIPVGCLGNLLVIIAVCSQRQKRNTTDILIVNLAVVDILFIMVYVPYLVTTYFKGSWVLGDFVCKLSNYILYVSATISVYTLVMMSLDRYLAIVHPITSKKYRTRQNVNLLVFITWLVVSGSYLPVIIETNKIGESELSVCGMSMTFDRRLVACFLVFAYVLPLLMISVFYGLILKQILYGVAPGTRRSATRMQPMKRVAKRILVVVIAFAMCWLPDHIINMLILFGDFYDNILISSIVATSNFLAFANSCLNPILYTFLSTKYRQSLRQLLCCKRQRPNNLNR
ncbi:allatostatin receptor [Mytilus galloprovincialis]|uniref:Allatostatin receptor n=1 Tax=Mytilus galloprovincialis TaxID=29158 RepID=A0A8B6GZB7_MYTGA|nr:allatostatin receptor [Mytilus galloprovincialis]